MQKDKCFKQGNNRTGGLSPFTLSLEELRCHLLASDLSDSDIIKYVQEMSAKFTGEREQIGDYVLDTKRVSAYTSFYLPTNTPKLYFLLSKLADDVLLDLKDRPFIDVGAGPGTFSLAFKKLVDQENKTKIIAVDSSIIMLDQCRKLLNGFFPNLNLKLTKQFSEKMSNGILFFGHSVNEIGIDKAYEQIVAIDPEYVMWIEPGTSELFLDLKKLRSNLLKSYDILYPCPANGTCPSDWCHQVLRISHHQSIERLSQMAGLDRKILPMVGHVYRRKKNASAPLLNDPVTVRFLNETKYSFEYEVCMRQNHGNGSDLKNVVVEIPKKKLSKQEEKEFKHASVGEYLDFSIEKEVQGKLRVTICRNNKSS